MASLILKIILQVSDEYLNNIAHTFSSQLQHFGQTTFWTPTRRWKAFIQDAPMRAHPCVLSGQAHQTTSKEISRSYMIHFVPDRFQSRLRRHMGYLIMVSYVQSCLALSTALMLPSLSLPEVWPSWPVEIHNNYSNASRFLLSNAHATHQNAHLPQWGILNPRCSAMTATTSPMT